MNDAVVLSNQEEWDECLQINTGENTNPLCLFAELAPPGVCLVLPSTHWSEAGLIVSQYVSQ